MRDVAREGDRVLEIVEHGDRGDDLCALLRHAVEILRVEEIRHELDVVGIILAELRAGRVDADAIEGSRLIGLERGRVVGADVEHGIAGLQFGELLELADLLREMADHRGVEAGAVAIVLAVHLARLVDMGELQEAGIGAPYEFERTDGHGNGGGSRKHASQGLIAEREDRQQVGGTANPAFFNALHHLGGDSDQPGAMRPTWRFAFRFGRAFNEKGSQVSIPRRFPGRNRPI